MILAHAVERHETNNNGQCLTIFALVRTIKKYVLCWRAIAHRGNSPNRPLGTRCGVWSTEPKWVGPLHLNFLHWCSSNAIHYLPRPTFPDSSSAASGREHAGARVSDGLLSPLSWPLGFYTAEQFWSTFREGLLSVASRIESNLLPRSVL